MEEWRPVEGFEGIYEVSNLGRVRNIKKGGRLMTPQKVAHGYIQIRLHKNGEKTQWLLHRLVAKAFIPNPENKEQVNHKDLDKSHNTVDNLEWVTRDENLQHAEKFKPWCTRRNSWRDGAPEDKPNYTANLWRSKVRPLREHKGLTQEELAAACCVRLDTLVGLEDGTKSFRETSVNTAFKLAWALGVKIEDLVEYDVAEAIRRETEWHNRATRRKQRKGV